MDKFWRTDDLTNEKEEDRFKIHIPKNNVITEEQEFQESSDSDIWSRSRSRINRSTSKKSDIANGT